MLKAKYIQTMTESRQTHTYIDRIILHKDKAARMWEENTLHKKSLNCFSLYTEFYSPTPSDTHSPKKSHKNPILVLMTWDAKICSMSSTTKLDHVTNHNPNICYPYSDPIVKLYKPSSL